MAFQKDYVLRMIEMMGDLIAALLGKIKKGDFKQAEEQLTQIYTEFLRKDAAFFRTLPIEEMTSKLIEEHNYTHHHLQIVAELFYAEAELQLAQNNTTEGKKYYQKSLKLLEFIDTHLKTYDEKRLNKLKRIRTKIEDL